MTKPLNDRLDALAQNLVLALDGGHEADSITTIEYLSTEAIRDLASANTGLKDLRAALKEALEIAWARGRGNFDPVQSDRLVQLQQTLHGWSDPG